jgi:hypothetical protein
MEDEKGNGAGPTGVPQSFCRVGALEMKGDLLTYLSMQALTVNAIMT